MLLKSDESNFINEAKKKLIELLDRANRETYKVLKILKSKSMNVKKIYKNARENWEIGKKELLNLEFIMREMLKKRL